jgi:hypothetical protein
MPGEFAYSRMFEQQVWRKLDPEPIFEFDEQEDRVGGIEPHASKRHVRVYRLPRQVERSRQILYAPISNRSFARVSRRQNKLRVTTDRNDTSLTALRLNGQAAPCLKVSRSVTWL